MIVDPVLRGQVAAICFQLPKGINGPPGVEWDRIRAQNALGGKMKSVLESRFQAEFGDVSEV
jgi:hypothetical protein